jgi:hypothetical protein
MKIRGEMPKPHEPRLRRKVLTSEVNQGAEITGIALAEPKPVLSVRTR